MNCARLAGLFLLMSGLAGASMARRHGCAGQAGHQEKEASESCAVHVPSPVAKLRLKPPSNGSVTDGEPLLLERHWIEEVVDLAVAVAEPVHLNSHSVQQRQVEI